MQTPCKAAALLHVQVARILQHVLECAEAPPSSMRAAVTGVPPCFSRRDTMQISSRASKRERRSQRYVIGYAYALMPESTASWRRCGRRKDKWNEGNGHGFDAH